MHEMGHCFFLDDMYDAKKYPKPLANCACSLQRTDTIMFGSAHVQPLDHAMLRRTWTVQQGKACRQFGSISSPEEPPVASA